MQGRKENTLAVKRRAAGVLAKYLGEHQLDKITPFIVEKYRIQRKEQDGVGESSLNSDIAILSHLYVTAINAGVVELNPAR